MKAKLLLLFSFYLLMGVRGVMAQYTPKYQVGPGEYGCFILDNTTDQVYDVTAGKPALVAGMPSNVQTVVGGAHHWMVLDKNGNVWCWGDNVNGECGNGQTATSSNLVTVPTQVTVDSSGNPFTNVIQVIGGGTNNGWNSSALKSDGTVWIWGNTAYGLRGNGQQGQNNTRPVQINFPAGTFITQISIYKIGIALDSAGNVWTWGGSGEYTSPWNVGQGNANPDYTTPTKISLPSRAVSVAGGSYWNYALLATGSLYGWGYYTSYLGIGTGGFYSWNGSNSNGIMTPQLLDADLNLPHPAKGIYVNGNATYVLLTDSTLWAWGDQSQGALGNGVQMNWATYHQPWNWDVGFGEMMQQKPVQIAPGLHSFTNLYTSNAWCFYAYAEDVNGQLYSWGRNKYCMLGNGVDNADVPADNIGAVYPDSWNVPWITAVNPFSLTGYVKTSSPYCVLNPSGAPCNLYSIPVTAIPNVSAGANQNITTTSTTLQGTSSGNGGSIVNYHIWTQVSGPNTALLTIPSGLTPVASGLVTGTYVFQLTATDNNWRVNTSTVTVIVNGSGNKIPVAITNAKQTITLPVDVATLTGSNSIDSDGTITAYAWSQISGPSTSIITTPTTANTTVTGMIVGTYIYLLTVTDNKGATGTAYDTLVVNQGVSVAPTVSAGSSQTITLPTSSVTLTGTATGNNGATISTVTWTEKSGPATATISSANSLSTTVSGLTVAGTYTFQLVAVDNYGSSAGATVTVTVNAQQIAPTVSAGSAQTIIQPASTASLTGTATGNNGATVSSVAWTQTGGPVTATISSSNTLSTSVSGLTDVGTYTFQLTATDNNGLSTSATVTVVVKAVANAPTVTVETDQTITQPASTASLTGTATGNNGATITSVAWTQTGGPVTATISSPGSLTTSVSGLTTVGVYSFKLTATDNNGLTNSATMTVTVVAQEVAPTVSAGSTQTITQPASTASLTGTATGNNGATISSVTWTQTGGPVTATISSPGTLSTGISGLTDAGTYTFQLKVVDNNGLSATATVTVIVKEEEIAPTVTVETDQTITQPASSANLGGTATGNNGATISSVTWTQTGGPVTATIGYPGNLTTAVSGLTAVGVYTFKLTAKDNNGLTGSATMTVTVVAAAHVPPVANAGPAQTLTLPTSSTTLDGSGSYSTDGTIVSYSWYQLSGGGAITIANSNTATPTVSGLTEGTYVFVLTVTDNYGLTATAQVTITVNASGATNVLTANAGNDTTLILPASIANLNGSASTASAGDPIVAYSWTQTAGPSTAFIQSSDEAVATISGLQAGTYTFKLTVTNQTGDTASAVMHVSVISNLRTKTQASLFIYPNPAQSVVNLRVTSDSSAMGIANFIDMNGRIVKAASVNIQEGTSETPVTVSGLAKGVYFIQLIVGNSIQLQGKMVKQ